MILTAPAAVKRKPKAKQSQKLALNSPDQVYDSNANRGSANNRGNVPDNGQG